MADTSSPAFWALATSTEETSARARDENCMNSAAAACTSAPRSPSYVTTHCASRNSSACAGVIVRTHATYVAFHAGCGTHSADHSGSV